MNFKRVAILVVVIALASVALPKQVAPVSAQDTDSVTVSDQTIINNSIWVDKVVAKAAGWIAIHASSDGFPVVGETYVHQGENDNVQVWIDIDKATDTMTAMLHVDAGKPGVYEFPGPDESWRTEMLQFEDDVRSQRTPEAGLAEAKVALKAVELIYAR